MGVQAADTRNLRGNASARPNWKLRENVEMTVVDQFYRALARRHSGTTEPLHTPDQMDPRVFAAIRARTAGPVLEISVGRSGWYDSLHSRGFANDRVDFNALSTATAAEAGLDVTRADRLTFLARQDDAQFGLITACDDISTRQFDHLLQFFRLAHRVLDSNGALILASSQYLDMSHKHDEEPHSERVAAPALISFAGLIAGFPEIAWLEAAETANHSKISFTQNRWLIIAKRPFEQELSFYPKAQLTYFARKGKPLHSDAIEVLFAHLLETSDDLDHWRRRAKEGEIELQQRLHLAERQAEALLQEREALHGSKFWKSTYYFRTVLDLHGNGGVMRGLLTAVFRRLVAAVGAHLRRRPQLKQRAIGYLMRHQRIHRQISRYLGQHGPTAARDYLSSDRMSAESQQIYEDLIATQKAKKL